MDAAGLALGVVPLLISAAEYWSDLKRIFRRYRHFDDGFQKFHRHLQYERDQFRSEVKLLLLRAMGPEQATQMVKDKNHELWSNTTANSRVTKYLGDNCKSCFEIVREIEHELGAMKKLETEFTGANSLAKHQHSSRGSRTWRHQQSLKFEWSFAESGLKEHMEELQLLNDRFRIFTNQAERSEDLESRLTASKTTRSGHTKHKMDVHQAIQSTSNLLYHKLVQACTKHTYHRAYFSLQPWVKQQSAISLRFDLSWDKESLQLPPSVYWFKVESTVMEGLAIKEINSRQPAESATLGPAILKSPDGVYGASKMVVPAVIVQSSSSRKRPAASEASTSGEKAKKILRFEEATLPEAVYARLPNNVLALQDTSDLCTHLLNRSPPANDPCHPPDRECLGYLERSSKCQLMLYLATPPEPSNIQTSATLSQILSKLQGGRKDQDLSPHERVRFAKLLATAALQFHSTPWLKSGMWRSENLCILGLDISNQAVVKKLKVPYIDVRIGDSQEKHFAATASPFIRNPILFGLGLVLIELAYQEPFQKLQEPGDDRPRYSNVENELASALRIAGNMSAKLGADYQDVVEKCLVYNFGDLAERGPQEKYHTEVIDVLDDLQQRLEVMRF